MSYNVSEFCRINVDFKEFKLKLQAFVLCLGLSPSSLSGGVATAYTIKCMYVCSLRFLYFSAATAQIKAQKHIKS